MNALTRSHHYPTLRPLKCRRDGSVRAPFLWRPDAGTLAFVMLIALAFLPATHAKNSRSDGFPTIQIAQYGRSESNEGYLEVYSATDRFDDGDVSYYAHTSYVVYTTTGKPVKTVENHISPSDETPDVVALPPGIYTVEARSEMRGYVRLRVVVKPGRLTILDLELEQPPSFAQLVVGSR